MKTTRLVLIVILVASLSFSFSSFGQDKTKIAIVPFKINSPENLDYLEGAIYDMLASRLSVDDSIAVLEVDRKTGDGG